MCINCGMYTRGDPGFPLGGANPDGAGRRCPSNASTFWRKCMQKRKKWVPETPPGSANVRRFVMIGSNIHEECNFDGTVLSNCSNSFFKANYDVNIII